LLSHPSAIAEADLTSPPELLGRDAERERIVALLEAARSGHSSVLLLAGEPGVGKSALLEDARSRAGDLRVLTARGVESESDIAFAGLLDLVRPVVDLRANLPAVQAAALEAALALAGSSPVDRFAVHAATLGLLAAAAEGSGLLVTVDDVHWLDAPTRSALLFAARRLEEEGVAVLMATRTGEAPDVERADLPLLQIGRLDQEAGRELLARQARLAPAVRDRVLAEAGGNPLALRELAATLSPAQQAGREPLPSPLPAGPELHDAFARRIRDLPADTDRALLVAAASDAPEDDVIAAALAELGLEHLALAPAEEAGLVAHEGPSLVFSHPALRSAIYHAAAADERRAAHRALAQAQDRRGRRDRAAWHLAAAAVEPDERVADALEQAGRDAHRRGGLATAASSLEAAGRLSPRPADRSRRLREAAESWLLVGYGQRAIAALDDALEHAPGPPERADVQRIRGRAMITRGRPRAAHDLLVHEADTIEPLDPARAAMLHAEACIAHMSGGDMAALAARARRAIELADAAGAPAAAALGRIMLAECEIARGEGATAHPALRSFEPLLLNRDLWAEAGHIVAMAAGCCMWVEDDAFAEQLLTGLIEHGRAGAALRALPFPLAVRSRLGFRRGHWAESHADAEEATRLARDVEESAFLANALAPLAHIEGAMGIPSARDHAAESRALSAALGAEAIAFYADLALGLTELGEGREAEAAEALERALETSTRLGTYEPGVLLPHPDLAEAYTRIGRTDDARRVLDSYGEMVERSIAPTPRAALARGRLLLTDDGGLDERIAEATRAAAAVQAPFEQARTYLVAGERLRRARRRADARDALRLASRTFDALGARPWKRRTDAELKATGERSRPRTENAPGEELTPQELRIALSVAEGATNKEVAAALFLSPKTIEYHLASVYRKLGVRSRTQLGRVLRDRERAA
jgi:DNA-binding CsgD family transcriptional regulator